MARVLMYCTATCPFCRAADRLLAQKGVHDVERVRVDLQPARRAEMMQRSGRRTVPQIWIGAHHVGGCDDLHELDESGELDRLLASGTDPGAVSHPPG
ncbi:MAG: glutaredoxin 3 [Burkholderiales bacterium]|nr:glutaredoxin 3 [Burkholderiales bacterium]